MGVTLAARFGVGLRAAGRRRRKARREERSTNEGQRSEPTSGKIYILRARAVVVTRF